MNKVYSISVFLLALCLTLSFVSATGTASLTLPASSAIVSGQMVLNSTLTGYTFDPTSNLVNVSFYAYSPSTANSSYVILNSSNNLNLTTNNRTVLYFNSSLLEDASDYSFKVVYLNASGPQLSVATNTGIQVNNTVPSAPSALSPTSITTNGYSTFSATVSNPKTTACSYVIKRGDSTASDTQNYRSGTGTYSGTSCTFSTEFSAGVNGNWVYTITASDGSDTASASETAVVNIGSGGSGTINLNTGQQIVVPSVQPGAQSPAQQNGLMNLINRIIEFFRNLF